MDLAQVEDALLGDERVRTVFVIQETSSSNLFRRHLLDYLTVKLVIELFNWKYTAQK
jgi:hypothetical protein